MSDIVEVALISMVSTSLPSIMSAVFSWRASRHAARAAQVAEKTEQNTNHMKDELVALTAKSSHAEGVLEGQSIKKEEGA